MYQKKNIVRKNANISVRILKTERVKAIELAKSKKTSLSKIIRSAVINFISENSAA
jgi:hypothetical protein